MASMILNELKIILKRNKIEYKELAAHLGLSESGLKKVMNAEDGSFSRLEQICRFLGVSLADVIHQIEDQELHNVAFTSSQEDFFAKDRIHFLTYWMLAYERRDSAEVQKLLQLGDRELWRILYRLDGLNLLRLQTGNRIKLPAPKAIKWVGRSKFVMDLYKKWSTQLISQTAGNPDSGSRFLIRYLRMSESTWNDLCQAMIELDRQFSNRAVREMRLRTKNLRHVRWLTVADNRSWAEEELKNWSS